MKTGEVLALANLPSFDPNLRGRLTGDAIRNRALTDTFEPGSTMKPFSIAAALEAGTVKLDTRIQTAPGRLTIGNRTIGDAHAHGMLTVEEIVAKSSNVGTAKIALELPAQTLWETYTGVGFRPGAARSASRVPSPGRLRPAQNLAADRAGDDQLRLRHFGVAGSTGACLHRSSRTMADSVPLTLLKARCDAPTAGAARCRPKPRARCARCSKWRSSPEGTAPRRASPAIASPARPAPRYKIRNGKYVKEYVASFVGFAPVSDPRIVVAVMIDEPGRGQSLRRQVAAPVFARDHRR